jgi:hypothetical protein
MTGLERGFVIWTLSYMAVYVVVFFVVIGRAMSAPNSNTMLYVLPFHFLGMAQNFTALVLTIRDLYLRHFPTENAKLTWLLLILLTGGIGWLIYVFKYAFKPRSAAIAA